MVRAQDGFSLMEALISVLVLSIGLLGLARLQAQLWKASGTLYATADAYLVSENHLERGRWETATAPTAVEDRQTQTVLPNATLDSTLEVQKQETLTEMEVITDWQDTAGMHRLRLRTACYSGYAADSRWLLNTQ